MKLIKFVSVILSVAHSQRIVTQWRDAIPEDGRRGANQANGIYDKPGNWATLLQTTTMEYLHSKH